jgi:hypothetical protein
MAAAISPSNNAPRVLSMFGADIFESSCCSRKGNVAGRLKSNQSETAQDTLILPTRKIRAGSN